MSTLWQTASYFCWGMAAVFLVHQQIAYALLCFVMGIEACLLRAALCKLDMLWRSLDMAVKQIERNRGPSQRDMDEVVKELIWWRSDN